MIGTGRIGQDGIVGVAVRLLGGFEVTVDGIPVPAAAWTRRQAITLVKLLALAPRRRLHREQVIDALWPASSIDEAAPRLHKAAHYARRVLGPGSVVLQREQVVLFPDNDIDVDVDRFTNLAAAALERADAAAAGLAVDAYGGDLIPEDRYEEWAAGSRERLRQTYLQVCRLAGRWSELVTADPTDAQAHLALMRDHAVRGDRRGALRQFERLDRALHQELGGRPSDEALALRDALLDPPPASGASPLVGRRTAIATLGELLDEAAGGRGRTVFIAGAAGMGKSALAAWVRAQAVERGWRTGHGVAAAVEGSWPYAPALEALADLTRRHPTLLDGLDDRCRDDIDRALSGRVEGWATEGAPQRLFVAVAELARLAAAGAGLVLAVEDLHEADEATLRLLHYLARSCREEKLLLVLTHRRQPSTDAFEQMRASLLSRAGAVELPLSPLNQSETAALVAARQPNLADDVVEQIWALSGGVPFVVTELARAAASGELRAPAEAALGGLDPTVRGALERIAILGATFDTDEFLAVSDLAEEQAFDCLDAALAGLVIERTLPGFQFRHPLIREALLDAIPPHRRPNLHRDCAQRLVELDASPARIGHHLLAAGDAAAAVPYVLRAAEAQATVGAFRDALSLVDSIRPEVRGEDLARTLALRADLLAAVGDPGALPAYREAIAAAGDRAARELRARMAHLAMVTGDLDAASAALTGLAPDGGPEDAWILFAHGALAYFRGDLDAAWRAVSDALRVDLARASTTLQLNLAALRSLITHNRGEWNQMLRAELMRTRDDPGLATTVFDSHLCAAEYLLYGPTPYAEVIALAGRLRATAQSAGALRAVAFAGALLGEAALLSGDLDRAERELADAVDLHHEISATAGEAHCLQRLAEVHVARGDLATANRLLRRALPLARYSILAPHLLQRIYGTMLAAAPEDALAVVDAAEATLALTDYCEFCTIMFDVPAAIACAQAGDIARARRYLTAAERSTALWEGTAWQAATLEARSHLAAAEDDPGEATRLRQRAAELFEDAAQPLDAARCRGIR